MKKIEIEEINPEDITESSESEETKKSDKSTNSSFLFWAVVGILLLLFLFWVSFNYFDKPHYRDLQSCKEYFWTFCGLNYDKNLGDENCYRHENYNGTKYLGCQNISEAQESCWIEGYYNCTDTYKIIQ